MMQLGGDATGSPRGRPVAALGYKRSGARAHGIISLLPPPRASIFLFVYPSFQLLRTMWITACHPYFDLPFRAMFGCDGKLYFRTREVVCNLNYKGGRPKFNLLHSDYNMGDVLDQRLHKKTWRWDLDIDLVDMDTLKEVFGPESLRLAKMRRLFEDEDVKVLVFMDDSPSMIGNVDLELVDTDVHQFHLPFQKFLQSFRSEMMRVYNRT